MNIIDNIFNRKFTQTEVSDEDVVNTFDTRTTWNTLLHFAHKVSDLPLYPDKSFINQISETLYGSPDKREKNKIEENLLGIMKKKCAYELLKTGIDINEIEREIEHRLEMNRYSINTIYKIARFLYNFNVDWFAEKHVECPKCKFINEPFWDICEKCFFVNDRDHISGDLVSKEEFKQRTKKKKG